MTHRSEWDMEMWRPEVENVTRGRIPRTTVSYVMLYGQLQESWIISGLQWRNVNEYHLPSKNAHSPNYCSWLAVCVKYSAYFYCRVTLINRFKLYLVKTYSKTPKKNKLNVNWNNVEYTLHLHLVNIPWRHPGWHYNVTPGDCEAVTWRRFDQSSKQLIVASYDKSY